MLFLNWYPGVDDPFLSSSLKITICSKRKTRRSLERDRTPASCSVTKKVSCCSSLPWLVSLPCRWMRAHQSGFKKTFSVNDELARKGQTSYPCSRPKFIMSLHSLGTWDIKSTAFCKSQTEAHNHTCAHLTDSCYPENNVGVLPRFVDSQCLPWSWTSGSPKENTELFKALQVQFMILLSVYLSDAVNKNHSPKSQTRSTFVNKNIAKIRATKRERSSCWWGQSRRWFLLPWVAAGIWWFFELV